MHNHLSYHIRIPERLPRPQPTPSTIHFVFKPRSTFNPASCTQRKNHTTAYSYLFEALTWRHLKICRHKAMPPLAMPSNIYVVVQRDAQLCASSDCSLSRPIPISCSRKMSTPSSPSNSPSNISAARGQNYVCYCKSSSRTESHRLRRGYRACRRDGRTRPASRRSKASTSFPSPTLPSSTLCFKPSQMILFQHPHPSHQPQFPRYHR